MSRGVESEGESNARIKEEGSGKEERPRRTESNKEFNPTAR
jgi:hypothetical protein